MRDLAAGAGDPWIRANLQELAIEYEAMALEQPDRHGRPGAMSRSALMPPQRHGAERQATAGEPGSA
ncbi:hypothetical protein [Rhodovastum atsumiense]|uniref:Uncharacterized protein n=1 Tax=Rhodovastum atsumiense TaxID=504468 RepID=A0A5M6IZS8_9PROT|nr:hypothetical protein [Rhodovastum atsumiense]KAA5613842.1 hypothetical protein F1189_03445 [Rhodovastum atsumiense]